MQYIIIKVDFTLALDNFRHRVWVSCLDHLNYLLLRNCVFWVIDFASRYDDSSMKFWNCPNDVVYLFSSINWLSSVNDYGPIWWRVYKKRV